MRLSENATLKTSIGFLVIAAGGFTSFLNLKWQSEANAAAVTSLQSTREDDRKVMLQIQLDIAEMKSDLKSIRHEMPKK